MPKNNMFHNKKESIIKKDLFPISDETRRINQEKKLQAIINKRLQEKRLAQEAERQRLAQEAEGLRLFQEWEAQRLAEEEEARMRSERYEVERKKQEEEYMRRLAEEEAMKKAEENAILANVPLNSNMLLTNITSFLSDNSGAKLFQKKLKKYLLKEGVSINDISNIFYKIFTTNPRYLLDESIIRNGEKILNEGQFGSVFANKSINKSKFGNNVQLNESIPIIIKRQNMNLGINRFSKKEINLFNYYKEALIQYILYNLVDEPFKRQIPKVYSVKYIAPNNILTIMEQIQGKLLFDRLNEFPRPLEFIGYIKQLFVLLKYLYETFGFIHCDIKAENIMIRDGLIVLLDYGFSSINKLPHIENPHFSLSVHDKIYNELITKNTYPFIDILMTLKMYQIIIDNIYHPANIKIHNISTKSKYIEFMNIMDKIFINNDTNQLYEQVSPLEHSHIRKTIFRINYPDFTYDNMISTVEEIERELTDFFSPI